MPAFSHHHVKNFGLFKYINEIFSLHPWANFFSLKITDKQKDQVIRIIIFLIFFLSTRIHTNIIAKQKDCKKEVFFKIKKRLETSENC